MRPASVEEIRKEHKWTNMVPPGQYEEIITVFKNFGERRCPRGAAPPARATGAPRLAPHPRVMRWQTATATGRSSLRR